MATVEINDFHVSEDETINRNGREKAASKTAVSRRDALRYAVAGALGIPATMAAASATTQKIMYAYNTLKPKPLNVYPPPVFLPRQDEFSLRISHMERKGNTTVVYYEGGQEHHIHYNTHAPRGESGQERSGLERIPDKLSDDIDGIIIETARERWAETSRPLLSPYANDFQYEKAMEHASAKGIPIVLAQPFLANSSNAKNKMLFETGSFGTGVAALCLHTINKMKKVAAGEDDYGRRSFMQNSAIPIAASAILMQPTTATLGRIISTKAGRGNMTADTNEFLRQGQPWNAEFFPDQVATSALLIEKIEWLMEKQGMKKLATIIGSDHTELETLSEMSHEDRMALLEHHRYFIRDAASPQSISSIKFMRAKKKNYAAGTNTANTTLFWKQEEVFHVPHLAEALFNVTGIHYTNEESAT
jgi:hypothetical protein